MFFKKKKVVMDSKFKLGEFVAFHMNGDLKHGVIKNVRLIDNITLYDINVGGEASWLAEGIEESKILKVNK